MALRHFKAELKLRFVPKVKLTPSIVWNIFRGMLTLIGRCRILTPIQPELNSIIPTAKHACLY